MSNYLVNSILEERGGRRLPPPLTHRAPPFSFVEVGGSCAKTMKLLSVEHSTWTSLPYSSECFFPCAFTP